MAEMKPCFGRDLAVRFGAGTTPIGEDPKTTRLECYNCPDLERCAIVVGLTLQLRQQRREDKKIK
ncbi:MAG: hypothetical protein J7M19_00890 [Planctomycetes bacterium]|nr:hypothetical protein [Planctomycetota bacterium]